MDAGPIVAALGWHAGPEEEPARNRSNPGISDPAPRIDNRFGFDGGFITGGRREFETANSAHAVEQRMNDEALIDGFGTFDPEASEERKIFTTRLARIDCQSPCGNPEYLPGCERAKVRAAEKGQEVPEGTEPVDGCEGMKTGKIGLSWRSRRFCRRIKLERLGDIGNFYRPPPLYGEQLYGIGKKGPRGVIRLEPE